MVGAHCIDNNFFNGSVTDESETSAFDSQSSSVIRLNNSTIIFMKEVSNVLAMICIWREENFGKSGQFRPFSPINFFLDFWTALSSPLNQIVLISIYPHTR